MFLLSIILPFPFICRNLHFALHSVIRSLFVAHCSWASIHANSSECGCTRLEARDRKQYGNNSRCARRTLLAVAIVFALQCIHKQDVRTTRATSAKTDAGIQLLCGWFLWPRNLNISHARPKKLTRKMLITIRSMRWTLFGKKVIRFDAKRCWKLINENIFGILKWHRELNWILMVHQILAEQRSNTFSIC